MPTKRESDRSSRGSKPGTKKNSKERIPTFRSQVMEGMDELEKFLRSGKRADEYFHVRRGPVIAAPPRKYTAAQVKGLRDQLGVSQSTFASALAVSIKTLQSWEQGVGTPPLIACRLLELIAGDLEHWRTRLQEQPSGNQRRAG